ncbi:MAG: CDP-alcohol phosphatidyltransferase family protein [Candidatus Melainabacteria bacterium]|nr:CDP-alcohol phosphatidyltransferase family protein [Candidatus Melainabacteria bacterium]
MKQIPNIICIIRTIMAILLALFVIEDPFNNELLIIAFWLTWIIIGMDGLDGIIARAIKAESNFGAFFDIACDRIVEIVYISLFAALQWIPFWILIVFLVRGILVDGIRGLASKEGKTAFGEKSMMETKVGYFLTSSRFMRFSYGGIKVIAFSFMFLTQAGVHSLYNIEIILVYLMTFYCVIRGLPVLIEGRRYFQ